MLSVAAPNDLKPNSDAIDRARELVDTYYGDRRNLDDAAELLANAYRANPNDAALYVEAARITVKGGFIQFDSYETGTFERYGALIDRAIKLDPSNYKAHLLKAGFSERIGDSASQLQQLELAKSLGTTDPWLLIGYGRYYLKVGNAPDGYDAYATVVRGGPGKRASERNAYVAALRGLTEFSVDGEDKFDTLRKLAAMALDGRHPKDAWTPLSFSEDFIDCQLFDDAIFYARAALNTMSFRAGKMSLAAALYGKAAQLQLEQAQKKEIQKFVLEAKQLGIPDAAVLEYLFERRGFKGSLRSLEKALREVMS
jgi:tetratricopeptide (TPR) repeat protein